LSENRKRTTGALESARPDQSYWDVIHGLVLQSVRNTLGMLR